MSELGFAVAVFLLSLAITYFFCLRPMRQGRCAMAGQARNRAHPAANKSDEAEIARLREEVTALRNYPRTGKSD